MVIVKTLRLICSEVWHSNFINDRRQIQSARVHIQQQQQPASISVPPQRVGSKGTGSQTGTHTQHSARAHTHTHTHPHTHTHTKHSTEHGTNLTRRLGVPPPAKRTPPRENWAFRPSRSWWGDCARLATGMHRCRGTSAPDIPTRWWWRWS